MTRTPTLLQLSGVIVDLVYRVRCVPQPGEEAQVCGFELYAGGGYNAMFAAHRAGMKVAHAGTVGTGPLAELVLQALRRAHIALLSPRHPTLDQGCSTVLVDAQGERTFIAAEGADGVASLDTLELIDLTHIDWMLLSGYALSYRHSRDALRDWLRQDTLRPPLVFDPSPVVATLADAPLQAALERAQWVSANATEARLLTGYEHPGSAAEALAESRPVALNAVSGTVGAGGAVVRTGADGCHVALRGQPAVWVPAFPVPAIDTNGAGDTHLGSFIAALARGDTATDAARYANAAAALATLRCGPATAPERHEVLALLADKGFQRYT